MQSIYCIVMLSLLCCIGISVTVKETNLWSRIFHKNVHEMTFNELETGQDRLIGMELSPDELKAQVQATGETILDNECEWSGFFNKKQNIDRLIDRIQRDIAFFEQSIESDKTLNDGVRERQRIHLESLRKLLPPLQNRERSYQECLSEYENLRQNYIESYKKLNDYTRFHF